MNPNMDIYAAGILDSKGVFSIRKSRDQPRIAVTCRHPEVLAALKEEYGGFIGPCGTSERWEVQGRERVLALLRRVGPHMLAQQDRARDLGNYCRPGVSDEYRSEQRAKVRGVPDLESVF